MMSQVCFPLFSFPKNPISPSKVASHFEDPKTPGPEKQVHSPGSDCIRDPERESPLGAWGLRGGQVPFEW